MCSFHSLAFFPLLILGSSLSPGMASPAWLFDWLVCVPRWSYHATTLAVCKNGSDTFVTHCVLPLCSKPGQLTTLVLSFRWKHARKHRCGNLTRALSMACTWLVITLNYSNKTKPSLPHSEECTALRHTVDLNQSSYWHPTQLDNGKISVKYYVQVS